METSWYKNAVFYSLDVETFLDSNGDGVGDFPGLIQKLEYIAGLGATCIWLLPFHASPNRDNGYDVMDYYSVDKRLGTLGDFAMFLEKAGQYGIRVIIDLVVNHTSDKHPWFKEARRNPGSRYYHYYVWSEKRLGHKKSLSFAGEEDTMWTFDKEAGQYYLHRFYKEQPDLNIHNEDVQEEILKIMAFWLKLGVSGFRVDAAEMLVESYGIKHARKDLIEFLDRMRQLTASLRRDAILLAEVNVPPSKMKPFLKNNTRMHMVFNFYINQYLFLAMATEDTRPLSRALKQLPVNTSENQWLNFLRHHDELSLKLLSEKQQEKVLRQFAPEKEMRVYMRGIRRRLAPMLGNDYRKIALMNSLMFSLPGVPMLRYGDEIGMGDNLMLKERTSVRTPMQWSAAANGGFSEASHRKVIHPVISRGEYGFKKVNVIDSQRRQESLLNWIERLITERKQCPEIGLGKIKVHPTPDKSLLLHSIRWQQEQLLFIHNLSERTIELRRKDAIKKNNKYVDIFCSSEIDLDGETIAIGGYGFYWLRKIH